MTNRDIIKGEAYLDMLKDKARETDMLAKENLELRRKINKAIEYIKEKTYNPSQTINDDRLEVNPNNLLDILKGVDKDDIS